MNYKATTQRANFVLNYKFWLITLLMVLLYSTVLLAQYSQTVYFDPSNSGDPDQDGSFDHPYDHVTDVDISQGTDYRFKRGTQMTLSNRVYLNYNDNIRLGAYGSGEKPILYMSDVSEDIITMQSNNNVIIDSLHLINNNTLNGAVRGIEMAPGYGSNPNTKNITISNCEIEGGWVGINVQHGSGDYYTENLTIRNCEIHHVGMDGILFRDVTNGLIEGCNIHNINQYWHTTTHGQSAGGDGIQTAHNCDSLKIYNNIIDRRSTGNKFCILIGNLDDTTEPCYTEIVGNTFYPPKDTTDSNGGVAVYLQEAGGAPATILFARNKIIGRKDHLGNSCQSAFRGDCDTLYFYYNIIDSCNFNSGVQRITSDCDYAEVFNNVFMGGDISSTNVFGVDAETAVVKNNLSAGNTGGDVLRLGYVDFLEESNNIEISSSNSALFNDYLSIANWETSDFTRIENLNDGAPTGLDYDIDSIPISNPPECGVCEFYDGTQTNTTPSISNQDFNVEENTSNGTQVGIVVASDPDPDQYLTYSILSGNTSNAFQINDITGELTVYNIDALDFESLSEFNLTIKVQDNGMGELANQAIITINVININEIDQPATWLDNNSTDWNTEANWDTGLVPNENTIVHIPGGLQNYPVLETGMIDIGIIGNGDYNCRTISIDNGGNIKILSGNIISIDSEGTLIVNAGGTIINDGTLRVNNSGKLYIMGGMIICSNDSKDNGNLIFYAGSGGYMDGGSITVHHSLQFLSGTDWNVIEGTIYCGGLDDNVMIVQRDNDIVLDNLIIKEGVNAQFVSDFYTYPLLVNGDLTLEINSNFTNNVGKEVQVNGTFLMESNDSGEASFVNYGTIDFSGEVEVQNYLEADRWHNISSPLTYDTAGVFMDMFLYSFNEAAYDPYSSEPSGWENIVDENTPLNIGEGYKVWSYTSMLGADNISFTGGLLNDGFIDLPVYATDQDLNGYIEDGEGWNLVGNPYPSGIDWSHQSWIRENIGGSVYVFDGVQYLVSSENGFIGTLENGIIPAMQSFFVKADDFNPSLSISNDSRIHGANTYKGSSLSNLLVISIDGNSYSDKAFIHFNENGSVDFDYEYDAYKLKGIIEAPQLYSIANSTLLTINVLPELLSDTTIELGFEVGKETEYVLSINQIESFGLDVGIYLEDKQLDLLIDLRDQDIYRFQASPYDEPDRFLVHFGLKESEGDGDMNMSQYLVVYANDNKIYLKNLLDDPVSTEFTLFNVAGQKVMNDNIWIDNLQTISTNVEPGFYIVNLASENGISNQKVFLR